MLKRMWILISAPIWFPICLIGIVLDLFYECAYQLFFWVKTGVAKNTPEKTLCLPKWLFKIITFSE